MTFVYITDSNYAMPTCVSIVSLIEHHSGNIRVYVIAEGLSVNQKIRYKSLERDNVEIIILDVPNGEKDEIAKSCLSYGIHVSSVAIYKFDIDELLSTENKVLYLDGDVIVNKNLSELFEIDISKNYVAAVDDMGDIYDEEGNSFLASRIQLKQHGYFNSGVMLLNLEKMRRDNVHNKLIDYRINKPNYFMDQDTFNHVFRDYRISLPIKYNFRSAIFNELDFADINERFFESKYKSEEECILDQSIIHLTDRYKPWIYYMRWFSGIFEHYYKKSPYSGEKINLKSVAKVLIDERNEYLRSNDQLIHKVEEYREALKQVKYKAWRFPKDRIPQNSRIIIWGYGDMGRDFVSYIQETKYCSIEMVVDKNYEKLDSIRLVKAPSEIKNVQFDYILVAVWDKKYIEEIVKELTTENISKDRIVSIT